MERSELQLHEIKQALQKERSALLQQLDRPAGPAPANPNRQDLAWAYDVRQRRLANSDRIERRLAQVELALSRLETGEYGICLECSSPINPERLLALPEAGLCIACQQKLEQTLE